MHGMTWPMYIYANKVQYLAKWSVVNKENNPDSMAWPTLSQTVNAAKSNPPHLYQALGHVNMYITLPTQHNQITHYYQPHTHHSHGRKSEDIGANPTTGAKVHVRKTNQTPPTY